jgi:hypothetical protein
MSRQPLQTRVIGCIELLDATAPTEIWELLVIRSQELEREQRRPEDVRRDEPCPREFHSDETGDRQWGTGCRVGGERCTRVAADMIQLRGELEDEFQQLCLRNPGGASPVFPKFPK